MKEGGMDWPELQRLTSGKFTPSMTEWVDAVVAGEADGKEAWVALVMYFGHVLAGVAEELGLRGEPNLAKGSVDLMMEIMEEQAAWLTVEKPMDWMN